MIPDFFKTFLCFLACLLSQASSSNHMLSSEFIAATNAKARTWMAGSNFDETTSDSDLISLLGGILPMNASKHLQTKPIVKVDPLTIPHTFDARQHWPRCTIIRQIRDQGGCGSCWAVNTASVITDRTCIYSNGTKQVPISSVDLISCCTGACGGGCEGGWAELAFQYWVKNGLCTGGEVGSRIGCKPYPFSNCGSETVSSYHEIAPKCDQVCTTPGKVYSRELHKGKSSYHIKSYDVAQIQMDIMQHGPVVAGMTVYNDLFSYKGGVYHHTTDTIAGGHYVRLLGWGTDNGTPYWLAANSWCSKWGDHGTFKILRGSNECGIEKDCFAGVPLY